MSIAFPTPDNASEKHSSRNKDNYKKPTKQPIEKSSFARVRDRAKTLSNTPPSTLVKLLLHEESTTRKTHQLLTQAVDRLGTASERATNAETSRRATEVQALLEKTKRDQELAAANDEARRAKNELEIYKLQLRRAQDEALRTQKTMKVLTERQVAAERNAAQARSLARKYRGRNLMMIAKEEGKLEGYREGLRAGREIIGAKYNLQEYEIQDGGSAFIEEYFEDAEGTTTAHSTPYSQSRRMSRKDETRKQRDTGSHTPRQMTTDGHPRSTPRPQPQPDLPTSSNGTQTSPATVLQAVQSPQPAPLPMTPPLISISAQQLSPTISASPISPHPRSLQPHSPIQGNDSSRAAGVPFPDPIVEPTPHPQQVAVEEPEVINIRRPSSSNSTPQALGPPVFSHSPTQSYTSPTAQILPHSSPSQASHTSSPLAENNVLGVLEYVPMPAPPISMPNTESQTTAEIQAPLPSSGPQNPEADRQREVDVSTPSTMTGIAGLATFPSYVPTASSDGTDQVPGVAGSAGSAGGGHRPPSATGSRAGSVRSVGSGDPWPGGTSRRRNLSTIYEQSREGTPGLTPMHTGNSLQSVRSQVRVDEWRRSLSQSGGTEVRCACLVSYLARSNFKRLYRPHAQK
ncbi:hypothetical protein L218DRAFT_81115 [Marasmius fiardii PR-910]|nr:hypothetical protein L218DRAFT_81115 [Marasmius fiardii PR-910]